MAVGEALDRFLTRRRKLPWALVRLAIHQRRITINGQLCKRYHLHLEPGDAVHWDGLLVEDGPDDGVLLCHKPGGYACSHQLSHAPLIYELVPSALAHPDLQSAGRLDRDTTGLLVLTIDGALIQRLTSPARSCRKRYRLRYRGTLIPECRKLVAQGLQLPDESTCCLPAQLEHQVDPAGGGEASLELREGRFHQVKRMIRALGGEVVALHREAIGSLDIPSDIPPGGMRPARAAELALLLTPAP